MAWNMEEFGSVVVFIVGPLCHTAMSWHLSALWSTMFLSEVKVQQIKLAAISGCKTLLHISVNKISD